MQHMPVTTAPSTPVAAIETPSAAADRELLVLILDDSTFDRRRLVRECEGTGLNFRFREIASLTALEEALDAERFDLAFVDYRLNDGDGLMALEKIYAHPRHGSCATIMIAGDADARIAVRALKVGCSDYIEKSTISPNSIHRAVLNAIQKSALQHDVSTSRSRNDALVRVLDDFADDCARDMKPVVSRILRQIRSGRTAGGPADTDGAQIERACQTLWKFLDDVEHYPRKLADD